MPSGLECEMTVIVKKPSPPAGKPMPSAAHVQLIAPDSEAVAPKVKPIAKPLAKPPLVVGKQPTATVTKQYKDGSSSTEEEPVGPVKMMEGPHATVGVSMGVTRNLGNYESVKFTVSLFSPSENTEEDKEKVYNETKHWVDMRIEALNEEISEQLK